MKKKFFASLLIAATLSLSALCGCFAAERGIASIEKTGSDGLNDYYTITYTNGTTSTYTVTNKADGGQNGQDSDAPHLTVDDVYEFYKQTYPDMTKEEFINKFLDLQNGGKGIASIVMTARVGLVDYYTITYTDGTTSTYTVTNGKDGVDGEDAKSITVDEVYEFYKQTNPDITKEEFVERFLTVGNGGTSQDNLTALSSLFRGGMRIYTVFNESSTGTYESYFTGSAVIYKIENDYAYILTNYHMVYDSKAVTEDKMPTKIFAYMYGSRYTPVRTTLGELVIASDDNLGLSCEYVGGSAECDVAIIKVPTAELLDKYPHAKAVEINQTYEVGQTVYALGNPNGQGLSLTKGIISVDMEAVSLDVAGSKNFYLLRTDADLDHGSSGGGLFNANGELVALCNAGSEVVTSINYGIPASTVAQPTASSTNPIEGYPAYKMGLQADDVIKAISINGTKHEINRMVDMSRALMQVRAGDSVTITVLRGSEEIDTVAYVAAQTDLVAM